MEKEQTTLDAEKRIIQNCETIMEEKRSAIMKRREFYQSNSLMTSEQAKEFQYTPEQLNIYNRDKQKDLETQAAESNGTTVLLNTPKQNLSCRRPITAAA